jgi:putative endonuclease
MSSEFLYVYLLKCSDGTYYTGVTNNLERRLQEHNSGYKSDSYTYTRRPIELVWSHRISGNMEAIAFEKRLKKWSKAKKEALINGDYEILPKLSSNKRHRESPD